MSSGWSAASPVPEGRNTGAPVTGSTIYQWTHQGYIPHVKLGKLVRFREKKVLEWIEKRSCSGRKTRRVGAGNVIS
ncbi:MAG: helix-turn-helix domain-containing protein [bacterium]|nr:helix-turn-helix domain-containing protein [bacterium]